MHHLMIPQNRLYHPLQHSMLTNLSCRRAQCHWECDCSGANAMKVDCNYLHISNYLGASISTGQVAEPEAQRQGAWRWEAPTPVWAAAAPFGYSCSCDRTGEKLSKPPPPGLCSAASCAIVICLWLVRFPSLGCGAFSDWGCAGVTKQASWCVNHMDI